MIRVDVFFVLNNLVIKVQNMLLWWVFFLTYPDTLTLRFCKGLFFGTHKRMNAVHLAGDLAKTKPFGKCCECNSSSMSSPSQLRTTPVLLCPLSPPQKKNQWQTHRKHKAPQRYLTQESTSAENRSLAEKTMAALPNLEAQKMRLGCCTV